MGDQGAGCSWRSQEQEQRPGALGRPRSSWPVWEVPSQVTARIPWAVDKAEIIRAESCPPTRSHDAPWPCRTRAETVAGARPLGLGLLLQLVVSASCLWHVARPVSVNPLTTLPQRFHSPSVTEGEPGARRGWVLTPGHTGMKTEARFRLKGPTARSSGRRSACRERCALCRDSRHGGCGSPGGAEPGPRVGDSLPGQGGQR